MVSWDTRMPSSSGYCVFSHPEICSGDQSRISLLATISRNLRLWQEGTSSAARPTPRLGHPPRGSIGRTATMAGDLPAHCRSRSIQIVELSHESMNRKRSLEICPLAQPG